MAKVVPVIRCHFVQIVLVHPFKSEQSSQDMHVCQAALKVEGFGLHVRPAPHTEAHACRGEEVEHARRWDIGAVRGGHCGTANIALAGSMSDICRASCLNLL